jgi:hypothetical protein
MRILLCLLLIGALAATAAVASAATQGAPRGAYVAAYAKALSRFADPDKVHVDNGSYRSTLDRSWSLVNGRYGRSRIWSAWVQRTGGRYRVRIFTTRDFDPGERVPCDIRPAYSEPIC